jgi:hypothetical protein
MAEDLASFTHDPSGFMRYAFPWGEGDLVDSAGPREWQAKINDSIGSHLRNPGTRFQPLWLSVASGHGIGKSAEIAMLCNWAASTCEDCKIVITAGTGTQLSTKTMPEVQKWFRRACNSFWWDINATSIRYKSEKRQANWRADAITWSEHNTEPFAGLHNLGKRILLIFDEASAIADKVWEVAEGAMTDEGTEIIWIAFGNPTQNIGRFKECFGRFKHRWLPLQIDSRTVEGTNKAQIAKWIEDYGEDSDFVRVRVKGEFPRAGSTQFIASDVVSRCRKFKAEAYESLPKILSVDVARFGDDQTVMGTRQGRKAQILSKLRGLDTVQVAERVIEVMEREKPEATVIDGDGIGAGVIDHLQHRGYGIDRGVFEFHGGAAARDSAAYFNRRAEVWGLMRDALMADMELPDDPELETDLTGPQYGFSSKQQIQLERKEDMKKRGLASPDCGDMLAMTFGVQVAIPTKQPPMVNMSQYGEQGWMA